jgi:hypothetical protein
VAGKTGNTPGNTCRGGDDEVDEIEVVKTFKFADYSGVSVAPLDTSKASSRRGQGSQERARGDRRVWTRRS